MELVTGRTGELQPGPYVDCPEEGCVYTLEAGVLTRYLRGADQTIDSKSMVVDRQSVSVSDRPRLHRISRMLVESQATARLASQFVVFVPRDGARLNISPGSGIVGVPMPGLELVVVYFQGSAEGQPGLARLADRVFHAHGRLVERYPTVARMTLPPNLLREVGTFDPASGAVSPVDAHSETILAAWLGSEELDPAELCPSTGPPA